MTNGETHWDTRILADEIRPHRENNAITYIIDNSAVTLMGSWFEDFDIDLNLVRWTDKITGMSVWEKPKS